MEVSKRRGRKPKKITGKGRSAINFRIEAQLRRELVEAAKVANRSLAAQIEWCISYALTAEKVIGDVREYARKRKGAIDIQQGRASLPGSFISEEEAAAPPTSTLPPALREEIKAAVRDALRDALDEAGILRRKEAA